ncbi:11694_t:CDS:2 [Funneliformis geosporum]|uniref:12027_t:CDS:1 n=1 Tax=Funneliformis geosporum TaxID=1117311 RepID=A0A9W4SFN2_9GLOM|nr:12027_t:CDS:2 [Funneliformis geosporum]CAI2167516.1 11694_t:CDS:2 [Funneliformis geosporum]
MNHEFPNLQNFPSKQPGLSNLIRVEIDFVGSLVPTSENIKYLIQLISLNCDQIRYLDISLNPTEYSIDIIHHIADTIKAQKCLMEFSISFVNINFDPIMFALLSQRSNLSSVRFTNITFTETSNNLLKEFNISKDLKHKFTTPAPTLPTECMKRIFQHIQDDPISKLYPSLLVNKYWCKNVVPFLWSQPFQLCSKHNRYKLIRTLLMFFSLEETTLINSKLKAYNILIPARPNPIFNYSSMVQEIYYMDLETFVKSYLTKITMGCYNDIQKVQILFITISLFQMLLRQGTNINTLVIDKEIYTMDLPDFSIFSESHSSGPNNLFQLTIDYNSIKIRNIIQFLKYISDICKDIQILEFKFNIKAYNVELLQSISETISKQNSLREFSLSNTKHIGIESVMMSLLVHIKTLTSISLAFLKLGQSSMDILLNLEQLKELRIWFCEGLNHYTSIHRFELNTLHLVELASSVKTRQITHSILQSTGNSITQLGFNIQYIENLDISLTYCPNVEEIILFFLSNDKKSRKSDKKAANKMEKSWRERLSSLTFKEISIRTLIVNKLE